MALVPKQSKIGPRILSELRRSRLKAACRSPLQSSIAQISSVFFALSKELFEERQVERKDDCD
jgi:hypothetical protein